MYQCITHHRRVAETNVAAEGRLIGATNRPDRLAPSTLLCRRVRAYYDVNEAREIDRCRRIRSFRLTRGIVDDRRSLCSALVPSNSSCGG